MVTSLPQPERALRPLTLSVEAALAMAQERFSAGQFAQAESIALEVLAREPENAGALQVCGVLAHRAHKFAIALALLEKAARLAPGDAQVYYNLGVVQQATGKAEAAAASYLATLAIEPRHFSALLNLGHVCFQAEDLDSARGYYDRALALRPDDPLLNMSRAMLAMQLCELEAADSFFGRALGLAPDAAQIRWEAAQYFLLTGAFERGWPLYEARFEPASQSHAWRYPYRFPAWNGEDLRGRHLLVHGEQGFGDEIMFLSIVPELISAGARISIVGAPQLTPLWQHVFPASRVYAQARVDADAWTREAPGFLDELVRDPPDFQISCGSLARWRRVKVEDFQNQQPYIPAEPERAAHAEEWLRGAFGSGAATHRLRVGIAWAGNPSRNLASARRKDQRRSIAPKLLAPLMEIPGIDWVSLQAGEGAAQVGELAGSSRVLDGAPLLSDFAVTAAICTRLDLVITVDTALAHLAGAMGKPVWILLPFAGEWRWGLDEQFCLWWQTARLFRQQTRGDWESAIARVEEALKTRRLLA